MSWTVRVSDSASVIALTQSEMEGNVDEIYNVLSGTYGWSDTAIAGALGNMQVESSLNPGACEIGRGIPSGSSLYFGGGLGLIQCTDYPAYQQTHVHPLLWNADYYGVDWYDGTFQARLLEEAETPLNTECGEGVGALWGWITSSSYPSISFTNYRTFNGSIDDAVEYWYYCMEWHSSTQSAMQLRKQYGADWYTYITGLSPKRKSKGMPVWMMCRRPYF